MAPGSVPISLWGRTAPNCIHRRSAPEVALEAGDAAVVHACTALMASSSLTPSGSKSLNHVRVVADSPDGASCIVAW